MPLPHLSCEVDRRMGENMAGLDQAIAVLLLAVGLALLSPLQAEETAEWIPDPAALPWLPLLTINQEPELCAHVLDLERQAFLTGEPASPPPGSGMMEWSRVVDAPENSGLTTLDRRGNPFFDVFLIADIDNDGDVDTLAVSPFSRNFFQLARYMLFDGEIAVTKHRNVADHPWSEVFPSATLLLTQEDGFQVPGGPWISLGAEPYNRTHPVDVLMYRENTFLLVSGQGDDGQDVVAVVSVLPGHTTHLYCLVSTKAGQDVREQFANLLALQELQELQEMIAATRGNNSACTGHHQFTMMEQRRDQLLTIASATPWLLEGDRIQEGFDESVLQFMLWGNRSLTTWRQLQRLAAVVAKATQDLSDYYQTEFAAPDDAVDRWADLTVKAFINESFWWRENLSSGMSVAAEGLALQDILSSSSVDLVMSAYQARAGHFRPYDAAKLSGLHLNALVLRGDPDGLIPSLLEAGPDFAAGWEPALVYAVGQPDMLEVLMHASAPVDAPNVFGKTALMYAVQHGDLVSASVLLDAGAQVSRVTWTQDDCYHQVQFTRTALDYAIQSGSQEMVDLLREHGAMTAEELGAENAVQH